MLFSIFWQSIFQSQRAVFMKSDNMWIYITLYLYLLISMFPRTSYVHCQTVIARWQTIFVFEVKYYLLFTGFFFILSRNFFKIGLNNNHTVYGACNINYVRWFAKAFVSISIKRCSNCCGLIMDQFRLRRNVMFCALVNIHFYQSVFWNIELYNHHALYDGFGNTM